MKSIFPGLVLSAALAGSSLAGTLISEPARVFNVSTPIADVQDPPLVFEETVNDSFVYFITHVEVGLQLVGVDEGAGFASEMFVSLNKDFGATSILLNQAGVTTTDTIGWFYDGWNVQFSDSAPNGDVHGADLQSGILQGLWQPDGRVAPTDSPRPEMLSVFNGGIGNGVWRLAVGDLEKGGQMRLESWSLSISGYTLDEPNPIPEYPTILGAWLLVALAFHAVARRETQHVN